VGFFTKHKEAAAHLKRIAKSVVEKVISYFADELILQYNEE
jgi:hypothetical protein